MTTHRISKNRKWVSLDPGGTTGWATWKGTEFQDSGQIACGRDMESQRHGVAHLVQLVTDHGANLIVFEDFLLRGGGVGTTDRVGLAPVHVTNRLCGTLEGIGWDFDYDLQLASVALPVITNERLKAKGLYVKGEHARDAVRHGVMYLRRTHAEHGGEA